MSTRAKSKQPRTSGHPARRAAQLKEAALKHSPRCECRHAGVRCGRRAVYRLSTLCAKPRCSRALHVTLMCASCGERAMDYHALNCGTKHRLRLSVL